MGIVAYETGAAIDYNNLLSKLCTFLQANGWTIDYAPFTEGTYNGKRAHISKGDLQYSLRTTMNPNDGPTNYVTETGGMWNAGSYPSCGIGLRGSEGAFNTSLAWHKQPGGPVSTGGAIWHYVTMQTVNNTITGNYHFFVYDDPDMVHVTIEEPVNTYLHLQFGRIKKLGTWNGSGSFFTGTYHQRVRYTGNYNEFYYSAAMPWSTQDYQASSLYIKADIDSYTGKWLQFTSYYPGSISTEGSGDYPWLGKRGVTSVFKQIDQDSHYQSASSHGAGGSMMRNLNYSFFLGDNFSQSCYRPGMGASTISGLSVMMPVLAYAELDDPTQTAGTQNAWLSRSAANVKLALIGQAPHMMWANMSGVSPKGVYTVGNQKYIAFPVWMHSTSTSGAREYNTYTRKHGFVLPYPNS